MAQTTIQLTTIKKRADFLAVRGGFRASVTSFLIEAKARREVPGKSVGKSAVDDGQARFGFTVTKKLGGAVKRNRIRRRIKAAITDRHTAVALAGFDYVVVARTAAFDREFALVREDALKALTLIQKLASAPAKPKSTGESPPYPRKDPKKAAP